MLACVLLYGVIGADVRYLVFQEGIKEGEKKAANTMKQIESNGLTLDAEPAAEEEKEKA